jgi:hypothetical protein
VSNWNRAIVGAFVLAILIEIGVTLWWYSGQNRLASMKIDPASALLVITTASVAIERAIEYFWTLVEMKWGSFWPLSAITAQANSLTDQLGKSIDPFIVHANAAVTALEGAGAYGKDEAKKLGDFLNTTDDQLQALKKSATGSQRIASYASAASAAVNSINAQYSGALAAVGTSSAADKLTLAQGVVKAQTALEKRRENPSKLHDPDLDVWAQSEGDKAAAEWTNGLPQDPAQKASFVDAYLRSTGFGKVGTMSEIAGTALSGLGDFLGTFKDNPGRRLLSIQIGLLAGLFVAAVGGLDVIAGVQNQGATAALAPATVGGIVFTGLLMGLGSSPTHEVISTLQQYKQQGKAAGAPTGTFGDSSPGNGIALTRLAALETRSRLVRGAGGEQGTDSPIEIESPLTLHFR